MHVVPATRGGVAPLCVRVMCTCAPYWKTPSGAGKRVASSALVYATPRGDAATVFGRRAGPPSASACTLGGVSDEPRTPRRRVDAVELSGSASESVELRFCFPPTGAYVVSKYREAYQTERIAPEVYVKDVDLETPPATLPANPALFAHR